MKQNKTSTASRDFETELSSCWWRGKSCWTAKYLFFFEAFWFRNFSVIVSYCFLDIFRFTLKWPRLLIENTVSLGLDQVVWSAFRISFFIFSLGEKCSRPGQLKSAGNFIFFIHMVKFKPVPYQQENFTGWSRFWKGSEEAGGLLTRGEWNFKNEGL